MYAFLLIGAVTMIYPFLLMIAGSTKSSVDLNYFNVVPKFLYDDTWLYRKHTEGIFNESLLLENMVYDEETISFMRLNPPAAVNAPLLDEWRAFLQNAAIPVYAWQGGYLQASYSGTIPGGIRAFKRFLADRYGRDIDVVNRELGTEFRNWTMVGINSKAILMRRDKPQDTAFEKAVAEFKECLPVEWRIYSSPEGFYKKLFLRPQYGDIEKYNREHGSAYKSYTEVGLPERWSDCRTTREKADWEQFVRETLALSWIRVDTNAVGDYRAFLLAKHRTIAVLNKHYGMKYASFDEIPLVEEPPLKGMIASDWDSFITGWRDPGAARIHKAPVEWLRLTSVEFMFRDFLKSKFGSIEDLNRRMGTAYPAFASIRPPQREMHHAWFLRHKRDLRFEFMTRNYKAVTEYVLFHGRGIVNTVVYCALAVLAAMLVNPLAAYALSRYKMPPTYKILLFLMATMAFPPMVTQIPNFLMLRWLNLLNTFAALILPTLANGYSIFLLKGFFDSLPRELYESAELDGASEWTIFWQLTMSLSKPILAVIALAAFNAAYANFMFAFVVCQDDKMWTLMVWLYQLQQMSGQGVMYASLIIAAIPTFIIFLFCQNIIMRGIVVPSEK